MPGVIAYRDGCLRGTGALVKHDQIPLWLGPFLILAGILGIVVRAGSQEFSARMTRRLLGERRAERYYGRMIHGGWSFTSVLAGAGFILVGVIVTVAAIVQR
jgi:hypothetical protein